MIVFLGDVLAYSLANINVYPVENVGKLLTKIPKKKRFFEMQLLGMLTSQNCVGLSLLTSEMNPENFKIHISKNGYLT